MDDIPGLGKDLSIVPNGEAEKLLGKWFWRKGFVGLEETIRENLKGLDRTEEVVEGNSKGAIEDEGVGVGASYEEDVGFGSQRVMEETLISIPVVVEMQRESQQSARISWRGTLQQSKRDGEQTTSGRNLRGLIAEARMAGNMDERWMLRRLV